MSARWFRQLAGEAAQRATETESQGADSEGHMLELRADAAEDWGRHQAYEHAAELTEAIAVELDRLASEADHLGTQAAFRRAARLVRGDDEADGVAS
jgi:hypothetical protein